MKKLNIGRISSNDNRDFNLFDFIKRKIFPKQVYWEGNFVSKDDEIFSKIERNHATVMDADGNVTDSRCIGATGKLIKF